MNRYILTILALACAAFSMAEDLVFRASAPEQVVMGHPFQLVYTVNQRARDFQAPDFEHFDHLAGPYTSQSSSTSFVNGKMSSTFTLTYTFTLMPTKEGTYTIPPASIKADGDRHQSNGVRITVLPEDQTQAPAASAAASSSSNNQRPSTAQQPAAQGVSNENIFVRTLVSKTKVCEQEAISLTYKLYFAGVDIAQFTNNTKLPDFTGFLKQEIEQSEIQTQLEHYNGRNYQTAVLYRTVLYPQRSGDITIDPAVFEAVLRVQTRGQVRSIFDDFFGTYTNVTRRITAPALTIHVDALPAGKPASFAGAVGSFTLTPSISATSLKANEPLTLRLVIKGSGNMKLLSTPDIDWPDGFEAYDPKITNAFKTTASGVSGTKTIECLAIPRAGGTYTIPPVHFSYYDPQEKKYQTLSTPEYTIQVERAPGEKENTTQSYAAVNKESIRAIGSDIRYIHATPLQTTQPTRADFFHPARLSSSLVLLYYLIPLSLSILLFLLFYRRIKQNADIVGLRYKQANKVAQKRLKQAALLLKSNETTQFYMEIERAAFSYLADRLAIPTSDLSKDNISSLLHDKQVPEQRIQEVLDVLSTAEYARYAPSSSADAQALYDKTAALINNLESEHI